MTACYTLDPHQIEAVDKITSYMLDHPSNRLLLVMPPRSGKNFVGAETSKIMCYDQRLPVLWLARSRELLDQAHAHLLLVGVPEGQIGMMMSGQAPTPGRLFQLGTFGAVSRRCKPEAMLVISDEAHWDAAAGRRALRALYPNAFHLGLTGSPVRSDGQGLDKDYDDILCIGTPSELITAGRIAEPRIFSVPPEKLPDLHGVRVRGGDYDVDALASVTDRPVLIGSIVTEWGRLAERRKTLVFPTTKLHSRHIVAQFLGAGVRAAHLDGDTPLGERESLLKNLLDGDLVVLSSVDVVSEGISLPPVKCGVIARPTISLARHIQTGFRPLTPWKGIVPLLLDHAGNTLRPGFGMPHKDRRWSLKGLVHEGPDRRPPARVGTACGRRSPPVDTKLCPGCGRVVAIEDPTCAECGRMFLPQVGDGELYELKNRYLPEEKTAEWLRIRRFAEGINASVAWAKRVYRLKMGEAPPEEAACG